MTFLIWAVVMAVAAGGGYFVVRGVLWLAQRTMRTTTQKADGSEPTTEGIDGQKAREALRGGMWIGLLERGLIAGFILAGFPPGIAIVVAIKGLGRYPELTKDNPVAAERFIIGTLTSLLVAAAAGWAGQHLLVRV